MTRISFCWRLVLCGLLATSFSGCSSNPEHLDVGQTADAAAVDQKHSRSREAAVVDHPPLEFDGHGAKLDGHGAKLDGHGAKPEAAVTPDGSGPKCAAGQPCSPGATCGVFDGNLATACDCGPGNVFQCGTPAPPQTACGSTPVTPICGPNQVYCASNGPAGCEMAACTSNGGTWQGPCEEVCPPVGTIACGSPCASSFSISCRCIKDTKNPSVTVPCGCIPLVSSWYCN